MSWIELTLVLDASPTNAVEVSVGTDADGDGALALDEAAAVRPIPHVRTRF